MHPTLPHSQVCPEAPAPSQGSQSALSLTGRKSSKWLRRVCSVLAFAITAGQSQEHQLPAEAKDGRQAYQTVTQPSNAILVNWEFLDKTDVVVSDGKKDATINYPHEVKALDGKRVAIVGFMAPFESLDDMTQCMILPAYVGCFYCGPPPVTQVLLIQQINAKKQKRPFINDAVIVTGTLRLFSFDSQHPAHQADFLYAFDDAVVEVFDGQNKPSRAAAHLPPDPRKEPKIY